MSPADVSARVEEPAKPSGRSTAPTVPMRRGWAARVFGFARGRGRGTRFDPRHTETALRSLTRQLVADDRYIFVLLTEAVEEVEERETGPAWKRLRDQMALIPSGVVQVIQGDGSVEPTEVPAFYLDRCAVTHEQYQRFVQAGGYDTLEFWPQEVWPSLMRFTDRTGRPGPRVWEQGRFPAGKADHPVVGVCWHEALAYARWVGKRLPTAAEWQKAGGWPERLSGGVGNRYPWGDIFDPTCVNLWASGHGQTVPVRQFAKGATPNGLYQISGNVWEWLQDPLEAIPCQPGETLHCLKPMRRIIGGAFDTYLPSEATCQFVTGQPELDRRDNIGFRCAVSADRLRPAP